MSFAVRSDTTLGRLLARKQLPAIGAVVLLFNAMTGPGIPFTPACFGNPGVWPTVLLFVVFAGISSMSMLLIVEAMQAIPGNAAFQGVVEYATLVNFYFGRWAHAAAQVFLYGAVQSNVCMSVVMAAQLTDHLLVAWAGKTCGLAVDGWKCVGEAGHGASPFGDEFMIFTLGLVVVVGIVMPLGFINLEDMRVQYGSFVLSVLILVQWSLSASTYTFDRVKLAMPPSNSYSVVAGTIMLNLAATTIIPSWINLKAKDVNVQMTVWFSVAGAALVYILVGLSSTLL